MKIILTVTVSAFALAALSVPASAQSMPGMTMPTPAKPAAKKALPAKKKPAAKTAAKKSAPVGHHPQHDTSGVGNLVDHPARFIADAADGSFAGEA